MRVPVDIYCRTNMFVYGERACLILLYGDLIERQSCEENEYVQLNRTVH